VLFRYGATRLSPEAMVSASPLLVLSEQVLHRLDKFCHTLQTCSLAAVHSEIEDVALRSIGTPVVILYGVSPQ
jgi:hypothetical protein